MALKRWTAASEGLLWQNFTGRLHFPRVLGRTLGEEKNAVALQGTYSARVHTTTARLMDARSPLDTEAMHELGESSQKADYTFETRIVENMKKS